MSFINNYQILIAAYFLQVTAILFFIFFILNTPFPGGDTQIVLYIRRVNGDYIIVVALRHSSSPARP